MVAISSYLWNNEKFIIISLEESQRQESTEFEKEQNSSSTGNNRKPGPTSVLEDGIIQSYDDHEDSVYVAEWSSADPWTFASLSYDGRLVVNQVPRNVKFKILNLV